MSLIEELKRRKVFKVGAAYLVVAWLAVQAASIAFPAFEAPPWALRVFLLVAMIGFPVAVVLAWALDVTPEGVQVSGRGIGGRRVYLAAGGLVALALAWYFYGQPSFRKGDPATPAATAAAPAPSPQAAAAADPRSIAVLPFVNMSGKPDEEYFSDGMTEELLNVLAKVPDLKVAARTSVFAFKGKGIDVREIGQKLGVAHLVEGSIRRDGAEVRVTAQLVRVADGFHVWSESYDRELKGVFALQDELARQIGTQLERRLGLAAMPTTAMPAARAAIDPAAYDEYLKGRDLYRRRTDLPGSVRHLARAVQLAPEYGAGWASLALAHEVVYWTTTEAQRREVGDSYAELVAATAHAALLEPDAAMTLHARGNVARAQGRFADALELYRASIKADPSYTDVREDYSETLVGVGNFKDGEPAIRELLKLDPHNSLFWWRLADLGLATVRRELVDEAMANTPDGDNGLIREVPIYWSLGRGDLADARKAAEALRARSPAQAERDELMLRWAAREAGVDEARARALIEEQTLRVLYAVPRGDLDLILRTYANEAAHMARHGFFTRFSAPAARHWLSDPKVRADLVRYGFVGYWRAQGWPDRCHAKGADDFECSTE